MRYLLSVAALLTVAWGYQPTTAEACGVKLTVRSGSATSGRSANPSRIYVLGPAGSSRLRHTLERAGHEVVAVENIAGLERGSIVLTSTEIAARITQQRPGMTVLAVRASARRTLISLEQILSRRSNAAS